MSCLSYGSGNKLIYGPRLKQNTPKSFFGIYGKFIPAGSPDHHRLENEEASPEITRGQQRNILPHIDGVDGGDVKLTPGRPLSAGEFHRRDEQKMNSDITSDIIGEVMHFDENIINGDPPMRHFQQQQQQRRHQQEESPKAQEKDSLNSAEKEEYANKGDFVFLCMQAFPGGQNRRKSCL